MKTSFLLVLFVIPAILCVEPFVRDELNVALNRIKNRLGNGQDCQYLLGLPTTLILLADEDVFDSLCSDTFFKDCQDQFPDHCRETNCDINVMQPWIRAFPAAGNSYICKTVGYTALNETYRNGGAECLVKVFRKYESDTIPFYSNMWNGKSVNCSYVDNVMTDVVNDINTCDNKQLRNLFTNYFNEVVNDSPCKGQFHVGSGVRSAASVVLAIVSVTVAYSATILH